MVWLCNILMAECLIYTVLTVEPVLSLLNLSLRKNTSQSSTHDRGISSVAVDGCYVQFFGCGFNGNPCSEEYNDRCCAHQAVGQNYAWWSVDLEQLSEISHIVVYLRNEFSNYILSNTRGYIIRVSNDSDPQSGAVCFNDTGNNMKIDHGIRNHTTCTNITGRHVHFTNTKPDGSDALLELCEVQVFGCSAGKYGRQCASNCSSSCLDGRCDLLTGACLDCSSNQYVSETGVCSECPNSCVSCKNYEGCINCRDTFYLQLNNTDKFCHECPQNCMQCEDYKGCTKCFDSFYLDNNICEPCSAICLLCSGRNMCSKCKDGYYLENSICNACGDRCVKCNSSMLCFGCEKGYFLLNGKCKSCSHNCRYCHNGSICNQCNVNYFKDNTGKCLVCSENCYNCSSAGCSVKNFTKITHQSIGTTIGAVVAGIVVMFAAVVALIMIARKRSLITNQKKSSNIYMDSFAQHNEHIYDELREKHNVNATNPEYINTTLFEERYQHIDTYTNI